MVIILNDSLFSIHLSTNRILTLVNVCNTPELEPDGFFPSGPVRPDSKFVWSGPVEIRLVHCWRQTGKNPVKSVRFIFDVKVTKIWQKSGFVQPDELAKIRFRPVLSGPAGPEPDSRAGSNSVTYYRTLCVDER